MPENGIHHRQVYQSGGEKERIISREGGEGIRNLQRLRTTWGLIAILFQWERKKRDSFWISLMYLFFLILFLAFCFFLFASIRRPSILSLSCLFFFCSWRDAEMPSVCLRLSSPLDPRAFFHLKRSIDYTFRCRLYKSIAKYPSLSTNISPSVSINIFLCTRLCL